MSAPFHSGLEISASLAGAALAAVAAPVSSAAPSEDAPVVDIEAPNSEVLPEVDRAALVRLLRSSAALRGSTSGQGA